MCNENDYALRRWFCFNPLLSKYIKIVDNNKMCLETEEKLLS